MEFYICLLLDVICVIVAHLNKNVSSFKVQTSILATYSVEMYIL